MAELEPQIGLVIHHAYLWWSEKRVGREEGSKDRPCVVVHFRGNVFGEVEVLIVPITHTPPEEPERAMKLPDKTKRRLGLDDRPSWIITTEVNRFIWPGPDVRSVPGGAKAYGLLPATMASDLVAKIKKSANDRQIAVVPRDDPALTEQVREHRRKRGGRAVTKPAKPRGRE